MRRRRLGSSWVHRRILNDTHVLLAIAIALAAIAIESVHADKWAPQVVLIGFVSVVTQLVLGRVHGPLSRPIARLVASLAFVTVLNLVIGDSTTRPTALLYLPIVAMGAAYGWRETIVAGVTSVIAYGAPIWLVATPTALQLQRGVALAMTTLVVVLGTRQTIGALEAAIARARTARTAERRQARRTAGVEDASRLLSAGVSTAALDSLMEILQRRFGYAFVSIFLLQEDGSVRMGAQRGYATVIESFDGSTGIVGRVMRTREMAFVPDVTEDPDYQPADAFVRSEISVPLIADGELLGVLNVEDPRVGGLDENDGSTLALVGERLAGAIALGRERAELSQRADIFQRLTDFSRVINASLDPRELYNVIVEAAAATMASDIVVLTTRDPVVGDYRIAACHGGDPRYVGVRIPDGEGISGRAIATGRVVVEATLERDAYPTTVQGAETHDALTTAAVPLLSEHAVLGALSVARADLDRPFTRLEQEVLPIIAGHVALAIANAELHARVSDAAIHDSLTGLFNRRHLDAALTRLLASRDRLGPGERRPVAAILFDLDHFGNFNKRHGHSLGDTVLETFGAILNARFRASDIVARYGGEEFLVILDGARLDQAMKIADDVRRALEGTPIPVEGGRPVHATVSAGCAAVGPDVSSMESLLRVADVALQMAKRAGRNQIVAA